MMNVRIRIDDSKAKSQVERCASWYTAQTAYIITIVTCNNEIELTGISRSSLCDLKDRIIEATD